MKIAQPMVGIEGMLTAPVSLHSEGGASKISFAESLRETLTGAVTPDAAAQTAKPDKLPLNVKTTDREAEGPGKKTQAHLAGLIAVSDTSRGVNAAEDSVATTGTGGGALPGTEVTSLQHANEHLVPEDSGTKPAVLPPAQQKPSSNEVAELLLGRGEEGGGAVNSAHREPRDGVRADAERGNIGSEKVSGAAKDKESEAVARHKQKHVSGDIVAQVQASQQDQPIESAGMLQPTLAPDSQMANGIASPALPQEASLPSFKRNETATQDSKPIGMHAHRQRQTNQIAVPASESPRAAANTVVDKMAEPRSGDAKPAVDPAAKPGTDERSSTSKESGPVDTPIVPKSEIAPSVLPIQAHVHAMVPTAAISVARPVHTDAMPQTTAVSSHTTYAPADHGTITATPTALEVGVPGGSHGWLKVRAELGGDGKVQASMTSNSAAGTEALRRELPQLTSYLHQEQVHLSSVVVHAPQAATELSNQASSDSRGQAMNGGSPDAHRGDAGREDSGSSHSQERRMQTTSVMDGEGDLPVPGGFGIAGGWLSVRA